MREGLGLGLGRQRGGRGGCKGTLGWGGVGVKAQIDPS